METARSPDARPAGSGAILVLPTVTAGQQGPVAAWVSAAGWASALRRLLGDVWIVTPEGVMVPDELAPPRVVERVERAPVPSWQHRMPVVDEDRGEGRARMAAGARVSRRPGRARGAATTSRACGNGTSSSTRPARDSARALGVPSVVFVPAPLVWQAEQWGVRRPGWGSWIERAGERSPLQSADVVACGSEAVADEVRRIGVDARRIVITPTGSDPGAVRARRPTATRRVAGSGVDGRFVVGWIGSFRRFHALEQAIDAVAGLDDTTLLLVGDGPERARDRRPRRALATSSWCAPAPSRTTRSRSISRRWTSGSCSPRASARSTTRRSSSPSTSPRASRWSRPGPEPSSPSCTTARTRSS